MLSLVVTLLIIALIAGVLGFGGMFGGFTYIAFTLTEVSGFATTSVPWLLVLRARAYGAWVSNKRPMPLELLPPWPQDWWRTSAP